MTDVFEIDIIELSKAKRQLKKGTFEEPKDIKDWVTFLINPKELEESEMKENIVIIGAGPAGLTAAYQLLKENKDKYKVVIIEADNQVGGISKSINVNGMRVDTGIHRFFTKDDRIENIWKELLPIQGENSYDDIILENNKKTLQKEGPDPEKEEKVMLIRDRVTRIYYDRKFFDYPISMKMETFKNLGFIKLIQSAFSYLKACIIKKEENSLENFYINRFGKKLYSMFFEKYTEKVWGRKPSQISADWGAQRAKGLSVKEVVKDMFSKVFGTKEDKKSETSLIEQFWYPKLGAGQMWNVMAEKIEKLGGKIIKNTVVKAINVENYKVISVDCYNEEIGVSAIPGDKFISSMPIKDLVAGISGQSIPEEIKQIAQGLPYREFMSVILLVDKINLKNKTKIKTVGNIIPDSWIYIQEPDVKMGRMQIFNNWSPYIFKNKEDIKDKVMISFEYFCNENDTYWNMSDEEFINFAIQEAMKINLIDKETVIEDSYRIKIPKAYPAYFDTYYQIDKLVDYLNLFDNLYCIGRNGQHRYNNMDHSMATGVEVANNIIKNIKSKENIWNVNTEKEYHEIKKY